MSNEVIANETKKKVLSEQEVFLAFSLTECFQISLLLTSKENESVIFFSPSFPE